MLYFFFDRQFHVLAIYRLGKKLNQYNLGQKINVILRYIMGVESSCELHFAAHIGDNVSFPHPIGIVIGENVVIGNNARIFQNVTIGSHGNRGKESAYPVIKESVTIYANSLIIGDVCIEKNAVIGANSLVTTNVEEGATYAGSPARRIN
jgi:serine O-acetyltransferase